jgi:hypothetical protein
MAHPMSLKYLADKVIARNQPRNDRATQAENATQLLPGSDHKKLRDSEAAELRELAGADWPECERDPVLLATFAHAVAIRKMRERGEIPPHYTQQATCAHCGPVWLWPGAPDYVQGCPWCLNRAAGKPVPRRAA